MLGLVSEGHLAIKQCLTHASKKKKPELEHVRLWFVTDFTDCWPMRCDKSTSTTEEIH